MARNVLHIRGEGELKFDVNEQAWPHADLATHSRYEGALIDGLLAHRVKAGDERKSSRGKICSCTILGKIITEIRVADLIFFEFIIISNDCNLMRVYSPGVE